MCPPSDVLQQKAPVPGTDAEDAGSGSGSVPADIALPDPAVFLPEELIDLSDDETQRLPAELIGTYFTG
jgi:hypothetical protein